MAQLTREDIAEVIRETVPPLIETAVFASEDRLSISSAKSFAKVEADLAGVITRLDRVESKLDEHDSRFDRVEVRLDGVEVRLERVENKLDDMVTPAQHRSLIKRVEAPEDKDC